MSLNQIGGQIKSQPLNDNFSYLDGKVDDIAGAGRTTETVKGNADALAAHLAESVTDAGGVHGLEIESGTWTPILQNAFGIFPDGHPAGYSVQIGRYYRVGNLVAILCSIAITGKGNLDDQYGQLRIKGIPFIAKNMDGTVISTIKFNFISLGTNQYNLVVLPVDSGSALRIDYVGNNILSNPILSNSIQANTSINFFATYEIQKM